MEKILLVAAGGGLGAVLRFLCAGWIGRWFGEAALGTAFVNVLGSFAMGVLTVVVLEKAPETLARLSPLLIAGLLGGFTTFSAFSLDAIRLFESGRLAAAAGYVGGSVILAIIGLFAGVSLARSLL